MTEVTWEKAMAHHSSTLAWKIPWTEEPGRPQSMGSLRVVKQRKKGNLKDIVRAKDIPEPRGYNHQTSKKY